MVTVQQEIEYIKAYVNVQEYRYLDKFSVTYEIEPDIAGCMMPKMLLQPLVENAVRYGIGKKDGGGTVTISSAEYPEYFEIKVMDDGVGYDINQARKEDGRTHIGIDNVRERLKNMLGGTLEIESEIGNGTTAIIKISKECMQYEHCSS